MVRFHSALFAHLTPACSCQCHAITCGCSVFFVICVLFLGLRVGFCLRLCFWLRVVLQSTCFVFLLRVVCCFFFFFFFSVCVLLLCLRCFSVALFLCLRFYSFWFAFFSLFRLQIFVISEKSAQSLEERCFVLDFFFQKYD